MSDTKPGRFPGVIEPPPVRDIEPPQPMPAGPLTHLVTVGWADCDPAQIAYTANIPGWGLAALDAWYTACLGVDWYRLNLDHGIGTPFVHLDFDFHAPVTPRAPLEIRVTLTRLGNKSLRHHLAGSQDGTRCFTGNSASAIVASAAMQAISMPPEMRRAIERFARAQGEPCEIVEAAGR